MNVFAKIALAASIGLCFFSGCRSTERGGFAESYIIDDITTVEALVGEKDGKINPYKWNPMAEPEKKEKTSEPVNGEQTSSVYADAAGSGPNAAVSRDRLLSKMVELSDSRYQEHIAKITLAHDGTNAGLNFTTTMLAGLASAFTDPITKTGLALGATGTSAAQTQFNQTIYHNVILMKLLDSTQTKREAILHEIRFKQGAEDENGKRVQNYTPAKIEQYPVDEAMADAMRYHNSGSFMEGLKSLASRDSSRSAVDLLKGDVKKLKELQAEINDLLKSESASNRTPATEVKPSNQ